MSIINYSLESFVAPTPVLVKNSVQLPRIETRMTKGLKEVLKHTERLGELNKFGFYDSAIIHKFGIMRYDLYVQNGMGVFKILKDGTRSLMGSIVRNSGYYHVSINGFDLLIHTLMFTVLCPDFFNMYMSDTSLQINHIIIEAPRHPAEHFDLRMYELTTRDLNTLHMHFVKRFHLYGIPVCSVDVEHLIELFKDAGVEDYKHMSKYNIETCRNLAFEFFKRVRYE